MKKCLVINFLILLSFAMQPGAQAQIQSKEVDKCPDIPHVSAYEAFVKYKAGKAIIFHAGGQPYSSEHIVGAINMDYKEERLDKVLRKFPKEGIEFFTYCY